MYKKYERIRDLYEYQNKKYEKRIGNRGIPKKMKKEIEKLYKEYFMEEMQGLMEKIRKKKEENKYYRKEVYLLLCMNVKHICMYDSIKLIFKMYENSGE
ncbi:MAG: hypothetical protein Q4Q07_08835 [Tissierellia bacterium]|nr:hypothetical protein [Tissierellia bacterium]